MRLNETCCGDCSQCELMKSGNVDMIPCVLDQIFQRLQRMEKSKELVFSQINTEEDELQRNAGKCQSKRNDKRENDVG